MCKNTLELCLPIKTTFTVEVNEAMNVIWGRNQANKLLGVIIIYLPQRIKNGECSWCIKGEFTNYNFHIWHMGY